MGYTLRTFDKETGIVSVEYSTGEFLSFPLPVNEEGLVPTGEELDEFVDKMKPVKRVVDIKNFNDIQKLVVRVPNKQKTLDDIKKQRNAILFATDWTQSSDAPLSSADKEKWAAYRQQLRDITKGENFNPAFVVWPTPPFPLAIPELVSTL